MPARSQPFRTRRALHPALFLVLVAALVCITLWGIQRYRHRFVHTESELLRLLPTGDVTTFYANLQLLRASGYLPLLSNNSTADRDYRRFVEETDFDFTRDVDAIAGAATGGRLHLFVKGRLHWTRLRAYIALHNGHCGRASCSVPTSQPGGFLSFAELQPDVMIAVISADANEAARFLPVPVEPITTRTGDPVWLHPATSITQRPNTLPLALRSFGAALQSADSVTISLAGSTPGGLDLRLAADFERPAIANTARAQLDADTKSLQLELAREHATPNPADLTGLLASGRFWTQGKSLYGAWPVHQELLNSLR